jgi:hypothetical protein
MGGQRSWKRWALRSAAIGVATLLGVPAMGAQAAAGWTIIPSPNPGTSNSIGGLVTFGPSETWAVGEASSTSYSGCHGRTLTLRFNGTSFGEVPSGQTPMCASVEGVSGTSTADIWAVGTTSNGRETHIRHWNGSDWSTVAGAVIPVPPSGGRAQRTTGLRGVVALGAGDVWAVGRAQYSDFTRRTLIEHWNGAGWSLTAPTGPSGTELNAVAAGGSRDVWAVGKGPGGSGTGTLVEHWNGSAWSVVSSPNVDVQNALRGVSVLSASDVWAVGDSTRSFTDGVSTTRTLIERWNGSSWSVVPSPNVGAGNASLQAVLAKSASDAWAVGYFDDVTGSIPIRKTLTMHWDGTRWTVVASPNAGTGDDWLASLASAAGSTAVWASGISASGTLIERFG